MVKNTKGGKGFKKQKKGFPKERELVYRENDQIYARIIRQLGDGRFECQNLNSNNNEAMIGKICGSLRKKVWVKIGDVVLASVRNFDTSSCDIIHKYTDDEAIILKSYGEIPSNVNLHASNIELATGKFENDEDDDEIIFDKV